MIIPLKKLLLHICCAPDATVVVERLLCNYKITGFFYNPISRQCTNWKIPLYEEKWGSSHFSVFDQSVCVPTSNDYTMNALWLQIPSAKLLGWNSK